ncbi:MAG: aspartate/glutamate racemase family protein [Candidatus Sungbacteria bacterium]|nr:aspartate/glutamate racemase family protein [Candidatus Sungbacteria bacterium]
MKTENQQRIGIVGGMGPMAGVLLQKLIIEATPATKDQDHLQVICFTNPQIPDRTASLQEDKGESYVRALIDTARTLVNIGVTTLVVPCNTAHTRLHDIQAVIPVPIIDMVEITAEHLAAVCGKSAKIGILATDGTLQSELYQKALAVRGIEWATPSGMNQAQVMRAIYSIKAGKDISLLNFIVGAMRELEEQEVGILLLGCTELSLYFEEIKSAGHEVIDPLHIVANTLVCITQTEIAQQNPQLTMSPAGLL